MARVAPETLGELETECGRETRLVTRKPDVKKSEYPRTLCTGVGGARMAMTREAKDPQRAAFMHDLFIYLLTRRSKGSHQCGSDVDARQIRKTRIVVETHLQR